jgi:quercetin dioxygenase-like cupin family protein
MVRIRVDPTRASSPETAEDRTMKVEDIESRELIPGTEVRFIHSDRMTVAYWTFEPAVSLPEHSHPHDQVTNIIEGEFELTIEGKPEILTAGDYRVIPPDAVHSGRSITACRIIDVFSPVREDYR